MSAAMLALVAWELSAVPAEEAVRQFEERACVVPAAEGQMLTFKYRMLQPASLEPGKKYPLVVFLHGAGERGSDNQAQLLYLPELMAQPEQRAKYPCFLIAPQCREKKVWVQVNWADRESTPMGEPTEEMQAVIAMLKAHLKHDAVDPQRVYLTGLSMGGYGSWDLAMRMPETFAAVGPICGGGDERRVEKLVKLPIWAWHGDQDPAVPVERTRRMIEALKKAGGNPKYSELKGVGHNSWTPAYTDPQGLVPWMFQQKRS